MSELEFDVIVLGTGPAGSTVARKASKEGYRVAIVESRKFGGTCALRGCNPKKVYSNAGRLVDQVRRANGKLITGDVAINWQKLLEFKKEFTEPVAAKSEKSLQKDGIETFQGTAEFVNQTSLSVGGKVLTAKRIVVATGAAPTPLSIPGEEFITHSDDFMELSELPERVVFIGGGYISMEFAHVAARCGKQVTVIDRHGHVLRGFDSDLVKLLQKYSEKNGIEFVFNRNVDEIKKSSDGTFTINYGDDSIDCDLVVHGAGRVPNLSNLNLDAGKVEKTEKGIVVDGHCRSTSNPHVFAAGDCAATDAPPLTPSANEEARIIVKNLFAEEPEAIPDYGAVPKVAFTTPSIASVGMLEHEAKESGHEIDVRHEDISKWGSVRKTGGTVAAYKVIIDRKSERILGAHLLGPAAEETINLFALAMKFDLSATDVKSTLFAFPTYASDVRNMV